MSGLTGYIMVSIRFLFLCLLLLLLVQSCAVLPETEVQASIDSAYQIFSGPSYPYASCDENAFCMNLGAILIFGPSAFESPSTTLIDDIPHQYFLADFSNQIPSLYKRSDEIDINVPLEINSSPTFMDNVRFMGGLEIVNKKSKDGNTTISLVYLETPLYAIYQTPLGYGNIFGGLGPYLAYGVAGKTKESTTGTKTNSFDSAYGYKRFDCGINLTAGYQLPNGFRFRLAYDFGLVNIGREVNGNKVKNRAISINASYPLNKILKK